MKTTNIDYSHSKRDGAGSSQKNNALLNLKGKASRRKANRVSSKQRRINRKNAH